MIKRIAIRVADSILASICLVAVAEVAHWIEIRREVRRRDNVTLKRK